MCSSIKEMKMKAHIRNNITTGLVKTQFLLCFSFPLLLLPNLKHFWHQTCVGFPISSTLQHQLGVLQLNSLPTLRTWRSVPSHRLKPQSHKDCPSLPTSSVRYRGCPDSVQLGYRLKVLMNILDTLNSEPGELIIYLINK